MTLTHYSKAAHTMRLLVVVGDGSKSLSRELWTTGLAKDHLYIPAPSTQLQLSPSTQLQPSPTTQLQFSPSTQLQLSPSTTITTSKRR